MNGWSRGYCRRGRLTAKLAGMCHERTFGLLIFRLARLIASGLAKLDSVYYWRRRLACLKDLPYSGGDLGPIGKHVIF